MDMIDIVIYMVPEMYACVGCCFGVLLTSLCCKIGGWYVSLPNAFDPDTRQIFQFCKTFTMYSPSAF
jgi:hypothetical protein